METRLVNAGIMTVNEKKFIEAALASDIRCDGRSPYEYRKLAIKFGKQDGSSEVHLGHTHVMGFVTGQLVQPYRDRPNEGALSIFTEFSPMADPSFEPGRPGEYAVELGRIVDRGLRESRAIDTESLCLLAGKLVWAIRIDLHILDNGGNLVDAANIAALAALLTFRRPDCTVGGEDGQEVTVHPPEVREPLPLIVHHLPIAVTFAFFSSGNVMVVDPTYSEEAVMGGKMTVTLNANGDICAIQKAGGEGVMQSEIMRCLRLASRFAEAVTKKIRNAVDAYINERTLKKVKRLPTTVSPNAGVTVGDVKDQIKSAEWKGDGELSLHWMERLKLATEASGSRGDATDNDMKASAEGETVTNEESNAGSFIGGPSSWDPYSKGVDIEVLKASLASRDAETLTSDEMKQNGDEEMDGGAEGQERPEDSIPASTSTANESRNVQQKSGERTLKDAIKPKNKRRKRVSSSTGGS